MNCCKSPRWRSSPRRREPRAKMTKRSQRQRPRDFITRFAEPIRGTRHGETRHNRTKPTRPADGSENVRRRPSRTTKRTQRDPSNFATTRYDVTIFNRSNKPGTWLETVAGARRRFSATSYGRARLALQECDDHRAARSRCRNPLARPAVYLIDLDAVLRSAINQDGIFEESPSHGRGIR